MRMETPNGHYAAPYRKESTPSGPTSIKRGSDFDEEPTKYYDWDLVMAFPRKSGDENKNPDRYTCDRFVKLMLGLRRKGGMTDSKDDIIRDKLRIILRTARCFLDDGGNVNEDKESESHEESRPLAAFQRHLEKEYKDYLGYSTRTTEAQFCELIAITIAKRLQLACGLTTRMFRSYDDDEIFLTIKADDMDLRVEADRTNYALQTSNKPFSSCHNDRNLMIKQMIGDAKFEESKAYLQKTRCSDIASHGDEPEMDPLLMSHGEVYQRHMYESLMLWGHNEEADSDLPFHEIERPEADLCPKFFNSLRYISWDPRTYFAAYAPYEIDDKYQPYFRWYPISWDSSQEETLFRQIDRIRLINSIVERHIGVDALLLRNLATKYFALHDQSKLVYLKKNWALNFKLITQPIGRIREYFGEKIALYFAWLEFYTKMLMIPSLVGFIVWIINVARSGSNTKADGEDGYYLIAFSVFVVVWSTMFTELWKRKSALYNTLWGVTDKDVKSVPRPQFLGAARYHPVTNATEMWFDSIAQRRRKIIVSILVVMFMILIIMVALGGLFVFKAHITDKKGEAWKYGSELVSALNAVQIIVLNMIYRGVAIKLNDWENHRTDGQYENFLITKVFLFQFVNSFASFFYIAFIKKSIEGECVDNNCFSELQSQLAILFIIRIVIGNLTEILVPYVSYRLRLMSETKKIGERDLVYAQAEKESKLNPYEEMESFDDYNELVIQYGFVTLFVVAFPLTPLLALINNFLEVHVDALKLCLGHRRPFPRRAKNIGAWFFFLRVMTNIGIITNCALLLFTSDLFEFVESDSEKWLIFVVAEHLCLLIKFTVEKLILDVPKQLQLLNERHEFIESTVFKGLTDESNEHLCEKAESVDVQIHPNSAWEHGRPRDQV